MRSPPLALADSRMGSTRYFSRTPAPETELTVDLRAGRAGPIVKKRSQREGRARRRRATRRISVTTGARLGPATGHRHARITVPQARRRDRHSGPSRAVARATKATRGRVREGGVRPRLPVTGMSSSEQAVVDEPATSTRIGRRGWLVKVALSSRRARRPDGRGRLPNLLEDEAIRRHAARGHRSLAERRRPRRDARSVSSSLSRSSFETSRFRPSRRDLDLEPASQILSSSTSDRAAARNVPASE